MTRPQDIARLTFAFLFALGAAANLLILLTNPNLYRGFADLAILPIYRQTWSILVFPRIYFFVGTVVLFEIALAVLLLGKGRAACAGLTLAAAYMLFLFPFWWSGGALLNLLFAILLVWLALSEYPYSVPELLRNRLHPGYRNDTPSTKNRPGYY